MTYRPQNIGITTPLFLTDVCRAYGLTTVVENKRRSNISQISDQNQHLFFNYFKTPSVGSDWNRIWSSRTVDQYLTN